MSKKYANGKKSKLSTILSGVAGEYFVAAELSRRGYVATLTLKNTKGIDILVSNANATRSVGIQVKTNQGKKKEWILNEKIEKETATNLSDDNDGYLNRWDLLNLDETGESYV